MAGPILSLGHSLFVCFTARMNYLSAGRRPRGQTLYGPYCSG
jgi:hypothetical protein